MGRITLRGDSRVYLTSGQCLLASNSLTFDKCAPLKIVDIRRGRYCNVSRTGRCHMYYCSMSIITLEYTRKQTGLMLSTCACLLTVSCTEECHVEPLL